MAALSNEGTACFILKVILRRKGMEKENTIVPYGAKEENVK